MTAADAGGSTDPIVQADVSADPAPRPYLPPSGAERLRIKATRIADERVKIDGRVLHQEWGAIPSLPRMMQFQPRYGARPVHPTEVRIAYGDRGLYVAFVCENAGGNGDAVRGAFGRKDQVPPSDKVSILVDPTGDGVTGYGFEVNASGAQTDVYLFRDDQVDYLWDGVWSAAAKRSETGWTVEIFIPWSTMRFGAKETHDFGIELERIVNEDAEVQRLSPAPQGVRGVLSYAARYEGITGIRPRLNLELRPYISGRFALGRSSSSLDQSWRALPNAGIEAKYGLTGSLTLDLAVNPDFGQAEVDPAVLNLGPFEVFFPERRQFFLESKEVFETNFDLFYSRRVGATPSTGRANVTKRFIDGALEEGEVVELDPQTRILDAARVTGEVAPGWRVGMLTATTGPTFGVQEFSSGLRQPIRVDPTTQWSVLRVRREFDGQTMVGGLATAVNRGDGQPDAYTGGLDYEIRFRERWNHRAQVIATHDGDEPGMGAWLNLDRRSRNLWMGVTGWMLTPDASFNDIGFMPFANLIEGTVGFNAYNAQPLGKVRDLYAGSDINVGTTFEGIVYRKQLTSRVGLTTQGLWQIEAFVGGQLSRLDPYETRDNIPYRFPLHWWTGGAFRTPYNHRISAVIEGAYGEQGGKPGPDLAVQLILRPFDRLEALLGAEVNLVFGRPRWVTESVDEVPIFGRGNLVNSNGRLQLTLGITPQLTLQSFNQLLHSTAHHTEFFALDDPNTLRPIPRDPYWGEQDQALTALISNSVLRWEYLPGSFLYLVYTHRTTLDGSGSVAYYELRDAFTNLVSDAARNEDILFLKIVHLFAL